VHQEWDNVVPELTITIDNQQLSGVILDDGSSFNILVEATNKQLGIAQLEPAIFSIKMTDQCKSQPLGIIHNIPITIT